MQTLMDTLRDVTRQLTPGQPITTVNVTRPAANASRWIARDGQARRLRRQRRMARSEHHRIDGWSVRTW